MSWNREALHKSITINKGEKNEVKIFRAVLFQNIRPYIQLISSHWNVLKNLNFVLREFRKEQKYCNKTSQGQEKDHECP